MSARTLFIGLALTAAAGCESANFSSGAKAPLSSSNTPATANRNANLQAGQTFTYGLKIGDGSPVVAQCEQPALPLIFANAATDPLSGDALNSWQSSVFLDGEPEAAMDAVKAVTLDLSKASGSVLVRANFTQTTDKRSGTATQSIFVDGEAPKGTLLRLSSAADGSTSDVFWAASDNYRVKEANSVLIGCTAVVADFKPLTHADMNTLPANCAVAFSGDDLQKQANQITMPPLTIAGVAVQPAVVHYALYVEDMVGLSSFTWITEPADAQAVLALGSNPASAVYTNNRSPTIVLTLTSASAGVTKQIDAADNSAQWSAFDTTMKGVKPTVTSTTGAFNPRVPVSLAGADGIYSWDFQVADTADGAASNHKLVQFILDTIPPVVSGIQINVPGGILVPTATVNLAWAATDANGIVSQKIEIMQTGATSYTQVAVLGGSATTYSFPWGTRSDKGFVIRITATDPAGNNGVGVSTKWTPQVFNAAVLTSSVQCYFCHMKIVGDLGGINFPSNAAIRSDSGANFKVTGKIYGTNTVPNLLAVTAGGGVVSNYDNSTYKIFPKNNVFPVITAAKLTDSVNGSLRLGNLTINRTYTGNLVLDGAQANQPIQINGEVFVNGDVVVRGQYTGVGTIYANNIYIVNDLIATSSPFPFADDPVQATAQAFTAIANKTDALYLGALNQVVVGPLETGLVDEGNAKLTNTTPYSWLPRASFVALATQAVPMKNSAGANVTIPTASGSIPNPADTNNQETNVEVNRVDAYIYAQVVFQWRSYANILLNGGFMSPRGGIVSTVPIGTTIMSSPPTWSNNPRNGLQPTQNVLRYDYRLRVGGAGFETIKSFFDQQ